MEKRYVSETMGISLRETLRFVEGHLGPEPGDVLEVGAGDGRLASLLTRIGHRVLAVDQERENVEAAAARGVRAVKCVWPNFSDCCFDAVLFTRSLHHIGALAPALAKAADVLKSPGRIIVEDFAFLDADEATISWFADLARRLAPQFRQDRDGSFAGRIAATDDPEGSWVEHSAHLHSFADMRSALADTGTIVFEDTAPYLYRYLEYVHHPGTEAVLEAERAAIERGEIQAIGRRVIVDV